MSETTIPDKITETISSIVQKGNFFAKVKKIEGLVYGCAMLITIFGSSIIMNSFLNTRLLLDNNNEQDNYQILIRRQNDKLQNLHYKLDKVMEFNKQLMILLFAKNDSTSSLHKLNDDSIIYVKSTSSSLPNLSSVTSLSSLTRDPSLLNDYCPDDDLQRQERNMIDEERAEKH